MNKTIKVFFVIISVITLSSCQRFFTGVNRSIQLVNRNYHIEQYSGGKLIKVYDFKGILNNSENSDGYYFYKNDTLIEISGDLVIKSN